MRMQIRDFNPNAMKGGLLGLETRDIEIGDKRQERKRKDIRFEMRQLPLSFLKSIGIEIIFKGGKGDLVSFVGFEI